MNLPDRWRKSLPYVIAAVIGLGTTWLTLSRGTAFGAIPIGAWTAWPKTGTQEPGRHTSEPLGGPTTLKEMVSANHDYRGDW